MLTCPIRTDLWLAALARRPLSNLQLNAACRLLELELGEVARLGRVLPWAR